MKELESPCTRRVWEPNQWKKRSIHALEGSGNQTSAKHCVNFGGMAYCALFCLIPSNDDCVVKDGQLQAIRADNAGQPNWQEEMTCLSSGMME